MRKCLACGGTFDPILPDGMQYFHACPPLAVHELTAGLEAGTVQLTRDQQALLDAAIAEDTRNPVAGDATTRETLVLSSLLIDRPNRRDENVVPVPSGEATSARIKAAGAGVEELAAAR